MVGEGTAEIRELGVCHLILLDAVQALTLLP